MWTRRKLPETIDNCLMCPFWVSEAMAQAFSMLTRGADATVALPTEPSSALA